MIESRPQQLLSLPHYGELPEMPVLVDRSRLPDLLKFDLFDLVGLLPVTTTVSDISRGIITVQPPKEVVDYYDRSKTAFTMVSIIANCYLFEESDGILRGYPYAINLLPASKRGGIDRRDVHSAAFFDLENMPTSDWVYLEFDPFAGTWGLCGPFGFLGSMKPTLTDQIGFVIGTYFLADAFERDDVLLPNLAEAPREIATRYRRWRIKRYFTEFKTLAPRRVWGVETPIELFLLQGLAHRGFHPQPQRLIYSNGENYASFHDMIAEESKASETPVVTEADLYFPDQKLAVFCDSSRYHRHPLHDADVVSKLQSFGIRSVRISGERIMGDLDRAVETVLNSL